MRKNTANATDDLTLNSKKKTGLPSSIRKTNSQKKNETENRRTQLSVLPTLCRPHCHVYWCLPEMKQKIKKNGQIFFSLT